MEPDRKRAHLALLFALVLVVGHVATTWALNNGLALTPPMGWIAWTRFTNQVNCSAFPDSCISERLFSQMAKAMNKDGYGQAGYKYVNIDDCWQRKERDPATNRLVADPDRFPSGIKALSNELARLGLELGLYGDCGLKTCAGYPAQLKSELNLEDNYFQLDAQTFADWNIGSFKFDGCFIDPLKAESICPKMAQALRATQRSILLTCEWPFYMMYAHAEPNYTLAAESCNLWRYYDDIEDSWLSILNTIDYTVKHQSTIVKYHGPGHWFDPDQLVIGNFGLSPEQERAQMAIWSIWAAPLFMSNDLRNIAANSAAILKNEQLIRVNQDRLGVLGLMVAESRAEALARAQVFVKPVEPVRNGCPSFAIVYLNRETSGNEAKVSFNLRDLLLGAPIYQAAKHQREQLRQDEPLIEPDKCLQRLASATATTSANRERSSSDESSAQARKQTNFKLVDLFGEQLNSGAVISLDSSLELLVKPSGVRAIKLEEMEAGFGA